MVCIGQAVREISESPPTARTADGTLTTLETQYMKSNHARYGYESRLRLVNHDQRKELETVCNLSFC